eukprot:scaffold1014_cov260-Pinguiococcus_pyrenoidosus.AAC.19
MVTASRMYGRPLSCSKMSRVASSGVGSKDFGSESRRSTRGSRSVNGPTGRRVSAGNAANAPWRAAAPCRAGTGRRGRRRAERGTLWIPRRAPWSSPIAATRRLVDTRAFAERDLRLLQRHPRRGASATDSMAATNFLHLQARRPPKDRGLAGPAGSSVALFRRSLRHRLRNWLRTRRIRTASAEVAGRTPPLTPHPARQLGRASSPRADPSQLRLLHRGASALPRKASEFPTVRKRLPCACCPGAHASSRGTARAVAFPRKTHPPPSACLPGGPVPRALDLRTVFGRQNHQELRSVGPGKPTSRSRRRSRLQAAPAEQDIASASAPPPAALQRIPRHSRPSPACGPCLEEPCCHRPVPEGGGRVLAADVSRALRPADSSARG